MTVAKGRTGPVLDNPRWVNELFSSTQFAWVWLMLRIYLGVQWLEGGWHKLSEEPWTTTGFVIKGFWERAVAMPEPPGRAPIAYDWYREFLKFMLDHEMYELFGKLVAYGEVLVGIGLLVGCFTGIAAFFGAVMNWNFMLAGTASTNPVLGILAIALIVGWKTAGWWGLDRFVLPYVGAPWARGELFGGHRPMIEGEKSQPVLRYVEEWGRMLIAAGVAIYSLAYLQGAVQLIIFLFAVLLAATTGLGLAFVRGDKGIERTS
jgi:thiosulfate dehydrogenase [quinone] large subunit